MKKSPMYEYIAQYVPDEFMDFCIKSYKLSKPVAIELSKKTYLKVERLWMDEVTQLMRFVEKNNLKGWTIEEGRLLDRSTLVFNHKGTRTRITYFIGKPFNYHMHNVSTHAFNFWGDLGYSNRHKFMKKFIPFVQKNVYKILDKAGM